MPFDSLALLKRLSAALLVAAVLMVSPLRGGSLSGSLPTPAAVVVVDATASSVDAVALPHRWWAHVDVPASQIASVPALSPEQAQSLSSASDLMIVRAAESDVWRARQSAARKWAIASNSLQFHPRRWLVGLFGMALAFALATQRWSVRAGGVLGMAAIASILSMVSTWLPPILVVAVPLAWLVSDMGYLLGMVVWAETRIASTKTRRPASQPTPLPVAHR